MHIMVTDDERGALNLLIRAVTEVVPGAEVHAFRNPLEALEFMRNTKCDVAFLDIEMREMKGIVLARKLKEIYPKVNIVFVTGYSRYMGDAFDMHASGYVYKPVTADKIRKEIENLRHHVKREKEGIYIRTFGDFELTVNGTVVSFGRDKSQEMLAYLVDRRGKSTTRKELTSVLFENTDYSRAVQDYMSKIIKELVRTLEAIGAEKILKRSLNSYSVDVEAFECDLYNYEKRNASPKELNLFRGEYMNQYSWGEATLASLYWKKEENV